MQDTTAPRLRTWLLIGAATAGAFVGGAGIAAAQTDDGSPTTTPSQADDGTRTKDCDRDGDGQPDNRSCSPDSSAGTSGAATNT
jgi:hypothetical protein